MKTVFEHIEHVKGKPHHLRRKVAISVAASVTALVALVWLVGSLSFGSFAIQATSFADASGGAGIDVARPSNGSAIAGAAAALDDADAPAHIQIVNVAATSSKKAEQTVIPF